MSLMMLWCLVHLDIVGDMHRQALRILVLMHALVLLHDLHIVCAPFHSLGKRACKGCMYAARLMLSGSTSP